MQQIIYVDNFLTGHGHTPTAGTTLIRQFREVGYTVIATSYKHNKVARLLDMVKTIFLYRKNSVVLIATYSTSAFYFACACAAVCRVFNISYIPCLHGGNLPARIQRSPRLSKALFEMSVTNVAVSGYLKESMAINGWNCVEIPNNIQLDHYPFRHRINIRPTLFWVRSFHETYNPTLAIRVLFRLRQMYPAATLTMVGPDKNDGSLYKCKALVGELHLDDAVTFTGLMSQEEWVNLSDSADIFINTTNFDNLPVSVIEAMALGMVVISTKVGGVPFLIEDGKTGIMVPPDNERAFVSAIEKLMNNQLLAASLSREANKKAEQFDWKNVKLLWENLFNHLELAAYQRRP